ncbi:MAG TPA: Hsp33 family molecular chaperone [Sneathiellales bacterium]|nr:Hsp33 family molecular chaperone [Sneathiellales bacterium]
MTNQGPDASLDPVDADDVVLPFQIEGMDVRGRVARLGAAVDEILHRHDYPESVSRLLGEALALTALLGCALKFEGVFSLQMSGDGVVSLVVVDFATPGTLRGYARFDVEKVWAREAAGEYQLRALLGEGHLVMTVDQGPDTERYQRIVALEGENLADSINAYFKSSEQIPTVVTVAAERAGTEETGGGWRAGAALIQYLPDRTTTPGLLIFADEHEQENWTEAVTLFDTVRADELTKASLAPGQLIYRLYHEAGVRVFHARAMAAGCRCSRNRVRDVLKRLPREELEQSVVAGNVETTCDFCNTRYDFTLDQIPADRKNSPPPETGAE